MLATSSVGFGGSSGELPTPLGLASKWRTGQGWLPRFRADRCRDRAVDSSQELTNLKTAVGLLSEATGGQSYLSGVVLSQ